MIFAVLGDEKTKPISSYCVLCDAYRENELEKTKPIGRPLVGNPKH